MVKKYYLWFPVLLWTALIAYVALFKVGNTDFWWHLKAGQVFRESGWITLDPFAYTREGLPYLAHHEWLAQVILSTVWDYLGVFGITILRMSIMILTFGIPVLLHRKNIWVNGVFAVLAAVGARPAFTDRPQLFSFLFFSLIVSLCIAYLELPASRRKRILVYLPIGIMLWSNLHGAASLAGIAVIGTLVLQRLVSGALRTWEWKWLAALLLALLVAPLLTPSGLNNIHYIYSLFTDNTASTIAEWQPAAWNIYLQHTALLWVVSLTALLTTRKNVIFSGLTLLGLGYMSRTAVRHEVLFLIAALAITVYQLRYNKRWNTWLEKLQSNQKVLAAVGVVSVIMLGWYAHMRTYDVNRVDYLFGYGLHAPGKGAYEFIERQNIEGPMFNNYNIGGELLYRGYPDRKVFVDGRNIDYGYEFLNQAINAGVDEDLWRALEEEYGFTHAVIYYDLQAEQEPIPYADLLDSLPDWKLVYLDDWTAVYAKDGVALKYMTPKKLHRQIMPSELGQQEFDELQNELNHMIDLQPDAIKARLYLARLYMLIGAYEPAGVLLEDAIDLQPNNYLIYVGMAQLHMEKQLWPQAWYYLKKAKKKAGYTGVHMDEELMKAVEEKAKQAH